MKQGDIVKFKNIVDVGDDALRMVLLENTDKGSVLVEAIVDMNIKPTYRYKVEELEVCGKTMDALTVIADDSSVVQIDMIQKVIERMKREVIEDVKSGQIPITVKTFAELHDYVDANEYGGFCEDHYIEALTEFFGGIDEKTGMPQKMLDFINAAQNAINEWIKVGGLCE